MRQLAWEGALSIYWFDTLLKGTLAVHQNVPDKKNKKTKKTELISVKKNFSFFLIQTSFTPWHGNHGRSYRNNLLHTEHKLGCFQICSHLQCCFLFLPEVRGLAVQTTPVTFRASSSFTTVGFSHILNFYVLRLKELQAVIIALIHFDSKRESQAEKYIHLNMSIPKYSWWQNIYKTDLFIVFLALGGDYLGT